MSTLEQLKALHTDSYGWALACCAWHRELAEDVLQESYLRVLDGRADFKGTATLRTWFFAVIKRVAADVLRTQKRRSILNLRLVADDAEPGQPASGQNSTMTEALHNNQTSQKLQNALLQLSQRQKEVLHLVFYSGLSLEEAATTVQITVGSARTHYHRGKERLLQILTENDTDAP
ncbi:ECF RNA polymerase sigma factor SigX [Halioglobus japonicus]|nr:ECF RNA polymerase sigma factor SigX [Halioglobus japonicus]